MKIPAVLIMTALQFNEFVMISITDSADDEGILYNLHKVQTYKTAAELAVKNRFPNNISHIVIYITEKKEIALSLSHTC